MQRWVDNHVDNDVYDPRDCNTGKEDTAKQREPEAEDVKHPLRVPVLSLQQRWPGHSISGTSIHLPKETGMAWVESQAGLRCNHATNGMCRKGYLSTFLQLLDETLLRKLCYRCAHGTSEVTARAQSLRCVQTIYNMQLI